MAKATTRVSSRTTLVLGKLEIPISLFSTEATPGKLAKFTTAGPNGGKLVMREVARPVPQAEEAELEEHVPVHSSDPFADEPQGAADRIKQLMADEAPDIRTDDRSIAGPLIDEAGAAIDGLFASTSVAGEYARELVEEGTDEVVAPGDERHGVRLNDGRFIDCTEQLEEIVEQTKLERAEIVAFVDVSKVPRARVRGAKYVGTDDERAPRALRMLFEAMRAERRVAVCKLTKTSRQTLGVLGWLGDALVFYELVWSEDFRPPPPRATAIQKALVTTAEVTQARELIKAMSGTVDAVDELRDDALALREKLMAMALEGLVPKVLEPRPKAPAEDELSAQLEASLAQLGG